MCQPPFGLCRGTPSPLRAAPMFKHSIEYFNCSLDAGPVGVLWLFPPFESQLKKLMWSHAALCTNKSPAIRMRPPVSAQGSYKVPRCQGPGLATSFGSTAAFLSKIQWSPCHKLSLVHLLLERSPLVPVRLWPVRLRPCSALFLSPSLLVASLTLFQTWPKWNWPKKTRTM